MLDSDDYNKMRLKLVNYIMQINKVANSEGKGRDDLGLDILVVAEGVLRKVSDNRSKSVRHLAEAIKSSFLDIRKVLRQFEDNIEIVDPQLKNNGELVDALYKLESTWEKGKEYLLNVNKYSQLLFFSQMIDILCEKYSDLCDQIETRDPNIFVWIPSILILKSLDNEDKGICEEFNPLMFDSKQDSNRLYNTLKQIKESVYSRINDNYAAYNLFEKMILFENTDLQQVLNKQTFDDFNNKLKSLSMQLQRVKPSDWNYFFDLAMHM